MLLLIGEVMTTSSAADGMRITRGIELSQHIVSPYAIVRTPDGGYVVAGSSSVSNTHGWAARLDSTGKPLWEYLDGPANDWGISPGIDRFSSAIVLPDNRVLLCGTRNPEPTKLEPGGRIPERKGKPNVAGRLVIVDADGHHLARDIYPQGDSQKYYTEVQTCLAWSDGVALVGSASEPTGSRFGWLVKLDLTGKFIWEKVEPFKLALDAVEAADHDLLVLSWTYEAQGTYARLDKIDHEGNIVLTRQVDGGDWAGFVRPLSGASMITIVTIDRNLVTRRIRLDHSLNVATSASIGKFSTHRNWFLADQSIAMFGSIFDRGDTAAVGYVRNNHAVDVYPLKPLHDSGWFDDAVPAGNASEFATVRVSLSGRPVLAWLSLSR